MPRSTCSRKRSKSTIHQTPGKTRRAETHLSDAEVDHEVSRHTSRSVGCHNARPAVVAGKVGLIPHFIDDMSYHTREGEIHCGTNVLRHPNHYVVKPKYLPPEPAPLIQPPASVET